MNGSMEEKNRAVRNGMMLTKDRYCQPMFPKVQPSRDEMIEKTINMVDNRDWRTMAGLPSQRQDKAAELTMTLLKESGYSLLPMTEKAIEVVTAIVRKGGRPVTAWTGKLLVKDDVVEEPPAFVRPGQLKVGDQVIPLQFVPMGVMGARFDLPYVTQQARRIKKIHIAEVEVTKNSYPVGVVPEDLTKIEVMTEKRVVALEFEPDALDKADDGMKPAPMPTRESTAIFRLAPMAEPTGDTTDVRSESVHTG